MAILIEHLAGRWPFFVSPRQVLICPVAAKYQPYCEKVYQYLHQRGYHCELDLSQKQLPNRISIISLLKRKNNSHPIDLFGFEINDEWVGCGLDDNGLMRNSNNIYEKGKTND